MTGERDNSFPSIHFAHGLVQYGRDNATVDMTRRTLKAAWNTKLARDTGVVRCFLKTQMQAVPVFLGAAEAVMEQPGYRPIERVPGTGGYLACRYMLGCLQGAPVLLCRIVRLLRDKFRHALLSDGFAVVKNFHVAIGVEQFLRTQ